MIKVAVDVLVVLLLHLFLVEEWGEAGLLKRSIE